MSPVPPPYAATTAVDAATKTSHVALSPLFYNTAVVVVVVEIFPSMASSGPRRFAATAAPPRLTSAALAPARAFAIAPPTTSVLAIAPPPPLVAAMPRPPPPADAVMANIAVTLALAVVAAAAAVVAAPSSSSMTFVSPSHTRSSLHPRGFVSRGAHAREPRYVRAVRELGAIVIVIVVIVVVVVVVVVAAMAMFCDVALRLFFGSRALDDMVEFLIPPANMGATKLERPRPRGIKENRLRGMSADSQQAANGPWLAATMV